MTDSSICPTEDNRDHVTLLSLPSSSSSSNDDPHPTSVLELGHTSMVTPKGLFLVHLTKRGGGDSAKDLKEAEEALFKEKEEEAVKAAASSQGMFETRINRAEQMAEQMVEQIH